MLQEFLSTRDSIPWEPKENVGLECKGVFIGKGSNAAEILVTQSRRRPTKAQMTRIWKDRKGRRPNPLLLVTLYNNMAAICGPSGEAPYIHYDLSHSLVERISEEALNRPNRHAAHGFLQSIFRDLEDQSMANKLDVKTLENWLWEAACKIRGEIDAPKYKDYILPLIFLKRLSDVFDDEIKALTEEFGDKETVEKFLEADNTIVRFFIPEMAKWENIARQSTNVGEYLTDCVREVARENSKLQSVIDLADFNATTAGQRIISDGKLKALIDVLSRYRLGLKDVEPDILGRAYEYLLRKFSEGSGQSAGEFYTPREVAVLMSYILDPEKGDQVYDPCCGSGGLLITCYLRFKDKYKYSNYGNGEDSPAASLKFYGQEILHSTFAVAKMNMFIHDMETEIKLGDTMIKSGLTNKDGSLRKFDLVTANPMWNQRLSQDIYENDPYGRFEFGYPPSSSADWGWIQHMYASLKDDGKMAVVLDTGAVSRGSGIKKRNRERDIRKEFVKKDLVESVILMPENLFNNTSAPGIILVINKDKRKENKILLINASKLFEKGRPKNYLPDKSIEKIANIYLEWKEEEGISEIITKEEAVKNDYNLSPSRYVLQYKLEHKVRSLIVEQNYSEARSLLKKIIEKAPERKQFLQNEFGFLYDFELSAEEDEKWWSENRELLEWRKNLWCILSNGNSFDLAEKSEVVESQDEDVETHRTHFESVATTQKSSLPSHEKGDILEEAVLNLFRRFFEIAEEDENIILQKLRRQKKGSQFGHDLSFECTVKGNENVKCHIECKNKKRKITRNDVTTKIAESEAFGPHIDHWILISPHSNPTNTLDSLLSSWRENKTYPFEVQIWCPETDIKEFFGLNPDVYKSIYKSDEVPQWSDEEYQRVFEKWKQKIKPVFRLPKGWEPYLRKSVHIFTKHDEKAVLRNLYKHYVEMKCMDERKNIIGQTLEQKVREWLKDTTKPVMFLLGEFGSGKTAFTYTLSRNLANEFLEKPSNEWIPVRFSLRDYHTAGNSQEFLKRRLEEFGATIAGWNELKDKYNLFVILDGFDEMTKRLDSRTIIKNIKGLINCCEEFKDLKVLITSRTQFFEKIDKEKLLPRIPDSCIFYLAPIGRNTNLKYLEEHVKTPQEIKKLNKIRKLHDPIGLASKPLFLHMIKETLSELSESDDLDEVTLYDTYIKKSLQRKLDNLDDYDYENMGIPRENLIPNLIKILEEIALKLQGSKKDFILLEEFSSVDKRNLAKLLWEMSSSDDAAVEDATARVGIRSLLTKVETGDDTHKWPVDFCHRSMREYFVAKGIYEALCNNINRAKKLLIRLLLSHEILYFSADLMRKNTSTIFEDTLLNLIKSTKSTDQSGNLGGNAATLLFRLKGELPEKNWSELNLDYADLSGANLSNKNFCGTSLQYARLDNVNFEGANFCNCDLTGVRIEETAPVLAVTIHPLNGRIIAAYGDNTIREWNISSRSKNKTRIICEDTGSAVTWLGIHFGFDLCAITNEEVIFYDFEDQGKLTQRARFRKKSKYRQVIAKKNTLLLLSDEKDGTNKVLLIDPHKREIVNSVNYEKVELCENFDEQGFVLAKITACPCMIKSLKAESIIFDNGEVKSLCVSYSKKDSRYLLAFGQKNGNVLVWQIDLSENECQHELLLEKSAHRGLVSSLTFLDDSTIISGGVDRRICILKFGPDCDGRRDSQKKDLHLTVRCKGMEIKGLKRDIERKMLEDLIHKVEKNNQGR